MTVYFHPQTACQQNEEEDGGKRHWALLGTEENTALGLLFFYEFLKVTKKLYIQKTWFKFTLDEPLQASKLKSMLVDTDFATNSSARVWVSSVLKL